VAAALVRADPRVVAFNFVAPEDYQTALRDYRDQMKTIRFLAGDDVPVTLHAGELWLGLVPPPDLTFHIRAAVEVAGARRIGHGVSLAFETGMRDLLAEMRRRRVALEINLTSNDVILGVRGKDHPLPTYLAAGVPVVLSTDDAGVSRIDLTNEYFRAARDYDLSYRTLKSIARNALVYSFLSPADKDRALKRFDDDSAAFEHSVAAGETALDRVVTVLGAVTGRL
jgi:adenosine deaminase